MPELPIKTMRLADIAIAERLELLGLKSCRPLPDAKTTIKFALGRFHESWSEYRTISPTLYAIKNESMGIYMTLGRLRRTYAMTWDTLDAILEALEETYKIEGYILATEAINEAQAQYLFALQGHHEGEKQYGALDLVTLSTFADSFVTEFDVSAETWQDLKLQARSNHPGLEHL